MLGDKGKGAADALHESDGDATEPAMDCCRRRNCESVDVSSLGVPLLEGVLPHAGLAVSGVGVGGIW